MQSWTMMKCTKPLQSVEDDGRKKLRTTMKPKSLVGHHPLLSLAPPLPRAWKKSPERKRKRKQKQKTAPPTVKARRHNTSHERIRRAAAAAAAADLC